MSSTIYDNDCSIIKQPVTIDEFKTVIDSLKSEIANLKKEIDLLKPQNEFIINNIQFHEKGKEDKKIEEKNKDLLLYLKSLITSEDFKDNGEIEIKYESYYFVEHSIIINLKNNPQINKQVCDYLGRRRLLLLLETGDGIDFKPKIILRNCNGNNRYKSRDKYLGLN
jgi:hypothetical protein